MRMTQLMLALFSAIPIVTAAADVNDSIEARLSALEERQSQLEQQLADMFDHGFQLQGSAMLLPKTLQAYLSGSKILGEYGNPWDLAAGLNWFPMKRRELRVNVQGLYLDESPVGYSSVPFAVGGDGWVFTTDLMLNF